MAIYSWFTQLWNGDFPYYTPTFIFSGVNILQNVWKIAELLELQELLVCPSWFISFR